MIVYYTVFALYIGVLAVIGVISARLSHSEADYWIAGGRLGWRLGGATLAATHASAGTFIGTIGVLYTVGWSFGWLVLSIPLAYAFLAIVLAPRFTRKRSLTLPAFLETRYASARVRGLGAAIILISTVIYVQAQIVAGGLIAHVVLGVPRMWGIVGFTVLLVAYTMIGGMMAVVLTDLAQLVVMVVGAALAVPLALRHVGGAGEAARLAETVNPDLFRWDALPGALLVSMGLAFTLGSVSTPEKLVRLYTMRDLPTIRRGVLLAMVVTTLMNLCVFFVALASVALFPILPSGDLAMPMVALSALPPVLGAVLLAAITAAMMSTVDSLLIVAGSALSQDLYAALVRPGATAAQRRLVDRLGVVLVGTVPAVLVLLGVGDGELVQFIVLLHTALMAAAFFPVVVGGVFWRRATKEGAIAAMLGGVVVTFLWKRWGMPTLDPVVPGFLVSSALLIGVSLLTPKPPRSALAPYFR